MCAAPAEGSFSVTFEDERGAEHLSEDRLSSFTEAKLFASTLRRMPVVSVYDARLKAMRKVRVRLVRLRAPDGQVVEERRAESGGDDYGGGPPDNGPLAVAATMNAVTSFTVDVTSVTMAARGGPMIAPHTAMPVPEAGRTFSGPSPAPPLLPGGIDNDTPTRPPPRARPPLDIDAPPLTPLSTAPLPPPDGAGGEPPRRDAFVSVPGANATAVAGAVEPRSHESADVGGGDGGGRPPTSEGGFFARTIHESIGPVSAWVSHPAPRDAPEPSAPNPSLRVAATSIVCVGCGCEMTADLDASFTGPGTVRIDGIARCPGCSTPPAPVEPTIVRGHEDEALESGVYLAVDADDE